LHAFLESKKQFADWIKHRIKKYGLVENQDFVSFSLISEKPQQGGRPQTEYALSLDCAKELAMVEGNERGKEARQYFIECEKVLEKVVKTLSPAEQLLQQAQLMVAQEQRLSQIEQQTANVEQKVLQLEAKTITRPDFFTIVGYGTLHGVSVNLKQAASLGRRASAICKFKGIETDQIPDPRFGTVKLYPVSVLDEVFSQPLN